MAKIFDHTIERFIKETLTGDAQKNALDFDVYLQANDMQFDRQGGYWEDKLYWTVWHKGETVCFIFLGDSGWTVWSDDSGSDCYADYPADQRTKEIAWANVDVFNGDCGGGQREGLRKIIFGKEFESLYRTLMKFDNPDAEEVECLKKIVEIRINDIQRR